MSFFLLIIAHTSMKQLQNSWSTKSEHSGF